MRYVVHEGSDSGHCCFDASVIDTERDNVCVCECFGLEEAHRIADALNSM